MKKYLNSRIHAPHVRKLSHSSSKPDIMTNLTMDLENQKTQCKGRKQKNLMIQTNFDSENVGKNPSTTTSVFGSQGVERQLFYPQSCKNARFSPQGQKKNFFDEIITFPRTAKNSPSLEIEKHARLVFSSKNIKTDQSSLFFTPSNRELISGKEKKLKCKFETKKAYKNSISRPNLIFKTKASQKENSFLKYNSTFNKPRTDSSLLHNSKPKNNSTVNKTTDFFNVGKLKMKVLCHYMDCSENIMNYSLTLNMSVSENTYLENYMEFLNNSDLESTEDIFNTEKGRSVKTYLRYEYFLALFIYYLGKKLTKNVEQVNEMLKLCVNNRFIILNLLRTEPSIKTPSKTLIEEFTNDTGHSSTFSDRESALSLFVNNTGTLIKYIEYASLILSETSSKALKSALKHSDEMGIADFILKCKELFKNSSEIPTQDNIYQNLRSNRPNFIIQPYRTNSLLPSKSSVHEYTLVLDLDETLIHCKRLETKGRILLRPHVKEFLAEMSKYYELVVFTAADQQYADWVLDRLDTEKLISHRLYRCSTSNQNGFMFKDLCKLGRDLAKLLIVDNKPENFAFQPENGIEILSWYDDPADNALLELKGFLAEIGRKPGHDIRVVLKRFVQS